MANTTAFWKTWITSLLEHFGFSYLYQYDFFHHTTLLSLELQIYYSPLSHSHFICLKIYLGGIWGSFKHTCIYHALNCL
jgi:hypothetical protein